MVPSTRLSVLLAATAPLWFIAALVPALLPLPIAVLAALLAAGAVNYARTPGRKSIEVRRDLPPRFSLGDEQEVVVTVILRGPRGADIEVRDHLPATLTVVSPPQAMTAVPFVPAAAVYRVRAVRRGPAAFAAVTLRIRQGPALVYRQVTLPLASEGRVYPSFLKMRRYDLLAVADRRDEAAHIPRSARGHGSDFESLRPYAAGDDLRRIDWKTTAKRGFLVSRTFRVDRGQQLTVLLDAGRFMVERLGTQSRFEHAVNAAVMLGAAAQTRGDAVSVACFSNRIESFMPAVKGGATLPRVLEALWEVQPRNVESDYWHVFSRVLSRLQKRCLVVLFCEVLDRASSAGLVNGLARCAAKHLVLAVVLVDERLIAAADAPADGPADEFSRAAAGHVVLERVLALNEMRSRGILVLETTPERLSLELVRRYLAIRRTTLL